MNSKVICFFVLIAVVHSAPQHDQPARYPAGVNPALCPGFPICDNSLLHGTPPVQAAPHAAPYTGAPAWNHAAPAWNHGAQSYAYQSAPAYNQWNPSHYDNSYEFSTNDINGPGGDKFPAGVNPAACPNYPYCDTGASGSHYAPAAAPLPGYPSRQYPAGVSAAACPNYPYCA